MIYSHKCLLILLLVLLLFTASAEAQQNISAKRSRNHRAA